MSKQEIIDALIKNKDILGIKNTEQASMIFDYIIGTLKNKLQHLEEGESFCLHNVGRFYTVHLKSRNVRNFYSGEIVKVAPGRKIRFKSYPSSNLT
ncbi:HU family DNA-binding protein [Wolbachia endosymbiont of Cantharis cryptica]|uniref:HU family DNA-binding protein n=1 Tax=Wolbachia endosymbiont of Cantharis cryptica TaxID=3066132 RepID=UPI00376EFEEE